MSEIFRNKLVSNKKSLTEKKKINSFEPLPWDSYFNYKEDLETDVGTFRIYRRGFEGPLLFFLHGGGFSALSWAVLSKAITEEVKCQCLAMDIRGHGETLTNNDTDLSADTLARDVGRIVMTMYPTEAPPIILIGHSMGGAIAIHAAVKQVVPSLVGVVVIDVVEGSALEALYNMNNFLTSRPSMFRSIEAAIEWSFKSGTVRNIESARVSFPGQLKSMSTNLPATRDVESIINHFEVLHECDSPQSESKPMNYISEVDDETDESSNQHLYDQNLKSKDNQIHIEPKLKSPQYTWRINLMKTEPFWKGWFQGMSNAFLSVPQPKLLLLAGIDRMDKELMIGQMQGKFQMHIIPQSGHAVHEDVPDKVADCLANFLVRNRFTEAKSSFEKPMPGC